MLIKTKFVLSLKREYFLVSPFMSNGDLQAIIKLDEVQRNNVKLNMRARLRIMYQITSAVAFLHRGVKGYRLVFS